MTNKSEKPSPEAKALSLFLMAYKTTGPVYNEKSKRFKRLWGLVLSNELSSKEYLEKVQSALVTFGGYERVVEKTVRYYIEKTGEWKLKGDDQYCLDAQKVADTILGE